MSDVSSLLDAAAAGDRLAAAELLPLLVDERRKLGAANPGQMLDTTALVHEAYIRLLGGDPAQPWNGRVTASPPLSPSAL